MNPGPPVLELPNDCGSGAEPTPLYPPTPPPPTTSLLHEPGSGSSIMHSPPVVPPLLLPLLVPSVVPDEPVPPIVEVTPVVGSPVVLVVLVVVPSVPSEVELDVVAVGSLFFGPGHAARTEPTTSRKTERFIPPKSHGAIPPSSERARAPRLNHRSAQPKMAQHINTSEAQYQA